VSGPEAEFEESSVLVEQQREPFADRQSTQSPLSLLAFRAASCWIISAVI
jgi:hypothetical protein